MKDYPKTNQEIIEYFVCGQCGGSLSLIEIQDEGERAYCSECAKTHTGVWPSIYELAKEYIQTYPSHGHFGPNVIEDDVYREKMNIRRMCTVVSWIKNKLEGGISDRSVIRVLHCPRCGHLSAHDPGGCLVCAAEVGAA